MRRDVFDAVGGFCARYFTYHEDVELCWRVRLAGWDVRFCPRARVRHAYAFDGKAAKWRHLERNRAWLVLSAYERRTLLALAPLLAATELGIAASAAAQRLVADKLAAYRELWAARGWLAGRGRRCSGCGCETTTPCSTCSRRAFEPAPRRPGRAPREPAAGRLPAARAGDAATPAGAGSRTRLGRGPPARPVARPAAAPRPARASACSGTSTSHAGLPLRKACSRYCSLQ